jgi:N-acetylglucosaminyldiphosphoundecaprenol N-acetyl-beta-D-mannosaminyltransferase
MDVSTMEDTVSYICKRIENKTFTQHVVVNVAKIVNMSNDPLLYDSVHTCDIINIDGMGVVLGARILGHKIPERIAGIDLFHHLLQMSSDHKFPIFLLGAKEEIVLETRRQLERTYTHLVITGHHHGYFWNNEKVVVKKIRESGARLLFVGISSPKKEIFINRWKDQLGVDFVMGVGGSFDVVAGKVKRAPLWMQKNGLEWFYRLIQEPNRMWKRYLLTNYRYACLLFIEKIKNS